MRYWGDSMQVKFVDVAGTSTRCLYAGANDSPPLLLIHGHDLIADIWSENVDVLGEQFQVVAPDSLGAGFTGPIDFGDRSVIGARVDHLIAFIDALGFDRLALCGSSYGALLASLIYLRDPGRISKLILNGSASAFNSEEKLVAGMTKAYAGAKNTIATRSREGWQQRLVDSVYDPAPIPPGLAQVLVTSYAQPWLFNAWDQSMCSFIRDATDPNYRVLHRLAEFDIETLIIWGRDDVGAPLASAETGVKLMPRARLEVLDDCGHMVMFEHAARYNQVVGDFLAG